ncbi:hypothetical protein HPB51_004159 [Rhipicephalus microplus]|uniref:Uncharacterized protein n=1 Tax=Rhipicephalus microplus TaxID=6941 RepID=A0A9J6D3X9_RHIMP|nr:hypothetical protein HPB51_004159 [Rhipicephalus microplus]
MIGVKLRCQNAAEWGDVRLPPAATIRTELLTPTMLPLAAAVVTLFISVATPREAEDGYDGDLVVDVYFGDEEEWTQPLRLQSARVHPHCWTTGATHMYQREGLFRPTVTAWFRGHNASRVVAHADFVGVYRDLSSAPDVWLQSLLALPSDVVSTRKHIRCGLHEKTVLPGGYTISYAVSRQIASVCRQADHTRLGKCAGKESVLLFNSTGGPSHEIVYTFQEPGTYIVAVTFRNPLSVATVAKEIRVLDEIRGLRVTINAREVVSQPFFVVSGRNVTLSATHEAGTDVLCSWRVLPACGSCLAVAPSAKHLDSEEQCVAWFLFPVAGAYSVTLEAWNDLGRQRGVIQTLSVVVQDRVKGLRVWTLGHRWVTAVGARLVMKVAVEDGTNATVAYKVPGRQWTPMRSSPSGVAVAVPRFALAGSVSTVCECVPPTQCPSNAPWSPCARTGACQGASSSVWSAVGVTGPRRLSSAVASRRRQAGPSDGWRVEPWPPWSIALLFSDAHRRRPEIGRAGRRQPFPTSFHFGDPSAPQDEERAQKSLSTLAVTAPHGGAIVSVIWRAEQRDRVCARNV